MDKNAENNNVNIESYDGEDSYYEGTDEDYEDFLKQVDGNTDASKDAADVESADGMPAGETINIKGVIDMVRKKAGEFGVAAKRIGGEVKEQISDYIAAASERAEEKKAEIEEKAAEKKAELEEKEAEIKEEAEDKLSEAADEASGIQASISNTAKAAKEHLKSVSETAKGKLGEVSSIGADIDKISSGIDSVIKKLDSADSKINEIEVKQIESRNSYDRGINDLRVSINGIGNDMAEMKQATGNLIKLNDAVFDLKNSQQNSKRSVELVEAQLAALRKKYVAGISILGILSAIMIVLEIINLLS